MAKEERRPQDYDYIVLAHEKYNEITWFVILSVQHTYPYVVRSTGGGLIIMHLST